MEIQRIAIEAEWALRLCHPQSSRALLTVGTAPKLQQLTGSKTTLCLSWPLHVLELAWVNLQGLVPLFLLNFG